MYQFAKLLNSLYFTYSNLEKISLLQEYLAQTPDPDRGFALAIISGDLKFTFFKNNTIVDLIKKRVDPVLFGSSYDYVGDLSETVALLWPEKPVTERETLPMLAEFISRTAHMSKEACSAYVAHLLDNSDAAERWAILKLGTGSLRIGVSTRFIKQVLAQYGKKNIHDIEKIWHGLEPPYEPLFAWLENKNELPDISDKIFFHPVMLANPLDDEDLLKIDPDVFALERKFDGIRVQLICTPSGKALFSRSGDNISSSFPDVLSTIETPVVLDGELVIMRDNAIGSFNDLQQRLNRKSPSKNLIHSSPGHIILYDILMADKNDTTGLSYLQRRDKLLSWYDQHKPANMSLSTLIDYHSVDQLREIRDAIINEGNIAVEGLMIKRKDSPYLTGRPVGYWYKWKRDPLLVDAVLMYAQRGHGKRSSYYSDYTFGLWQDDQLLPIGKAYSGFTDAELLQLDKWIRHNAIQSFGPVREVKKALVFEVAFDAVNVSARHKSGVALRFPRINRIRWDKPASEADHLESLKKLIK